MAWNLEFLKIETSGARRFNYSAKSKIKSWNAIGSPPPLVRGIDSRQVCRVIRGKYVHKSLLSAEREGNAGSRAARDGRNTGV